MICREPFKCLNIEDDKISSCCLMAPWKGNDFINDEKLNNVRQTWLQGQWPTACHSCKSTEEASQTSRRQAVESWFTENNVTGTNVELVRLDYWLGNTCNLRCPICGPNYSIAWQNDLNIETNVIVNERWRELNLESLRWIHFNGGEPLLIDHTEFLNAIPNKERVHLNYNTNGTVRPKAELIDVWSKFKLVQLDFSIDDIGDRFEYSRFPAKWEVVRNNLFWFRDTMPVNFMFDINATVSVLNVLTINELEDWVNDNFKENRLGDPINFRKQNASGALSVDKTVSNVVSYLDSLDARRKTNWRQTFVELSTFLDTVERPSETKMKGRLTNTGLLTS